MVCEKTIKLHILAELGIYMKLWLLLSYKIPDELCSTIYFYTFHVGLIRCFFLTGWVIAEKKYLCIRNSSQEMFLSHGGKSVVICHVTPLVTNIHKVASFPPSIQPVQAVILTTSDLGLQHPSRFISTGFAFCSHGTLIVDERACFRLYSDIAYLCGALV